jgi:molybdopterin converting factor small subunit
MAVVFFIPGPLRGFTGGQARVEIGAAPATVGEALEQLWKLHPGVRDRLVTETGEVRTHVNLFVGVESVRSTGGLATPIPEGAEISIIPAISGG